MQKAIKISLVLCSVITQSAVQNLNAQSYFTWETAEMVGETIQETVDLITVTVSGEPTEGEGGIGIMNAGGAKGSSGIIVAASYNVLEITFTFSDAVDISTIYALEGYFSGGSILWVYTPTGGSNSIVYDNFDAGEGKTVTLNWTGVTSFTVTKYESLSGFGFDTITFNDASLPVSLTSFNAFIENQAISLDWVTESETNNLGFILERCDSHSDWVTIASYETCKDLKGSGSVSTRKKYSFSDVNVTMNQLYSYRLSDVSMDGKLTVLSSLSLELTPDVMPATTHLEQAYPNPFNPQTNISYNLHKTTYAEIAVFDILGRKVKTLAGGVQNAGNYGLSWNGRDNEGNEVSAGLYLIHLQTSETNQVQKVLYIK